MNWEEMSRYLVGRITDLYFETSVYQVPATVIEDVLRFLKRTVRPEIGGKFLLVPGERDEFNIRVVFASGE